MRLFSRVDQEKEQRKSARGDSALFDSQTVDNAQNFFEGESANFVVTAGARSDA
jgi:hypothetical protein